MGGGGPSPRKGGCLGKDRGFLFGGEKGGGGGVPVLIRRGFSAKHSV